jgi:uncharacterized repeat protein (TIGR01451 family)
LLLLLLLLLLPTAARLTNYLVFVQAPAIPQGVPEMQIQKAVSKAQVTQGSRFNYTFNVKNLGSLDPASSTAYNVIVSDTFPVGVAPTNSYWIEPESLSSGKEGPLTVQQTITTLLSVCVCAWR